MFLKKTPHLHLLISTMVLLTPLRVQADLDMLPGELQSSQQKEETPEKKPNPPPKKDAPKPPAAKKPTSSKPSTPPPSALPAQKEAVTLAKPKPSPTTPSPTVTLPYGSSFLKVWAETVRGYGKKGQFSLKGNVRLEYEGFKIHCSEAEVEFHPQTWDVRLIRARGPVTLTGKDPKSHKEVEGRALEMIYEQRQDQLTLRGDVKLRRGGERIQGRELIYNLTTGTVESKEVSGMVLPHKSP